MTGRPRLLFIAPWFLFPASNGGRIRTRDVLRGLKGGRFEITLVSPEPEDPAAHRDELESVCDRFVGWRPGRRGPLFPYVRLRYLPARLPVSVATDRSPAARRAIEAELAREPDLVVVDFVHTAVVVPDRLDRPSVVFTHNVEAEIFRRHAEVAGNPLVRTIWRDQYAKMARFEGEALRRFDMVVAVSERDRDHFAARYALANVAVIPTGVDLDYFSPGPRGGGTEGAHLVFTGSMDWMPNIDAVQHFMTDIWPRIAAARPDARFTVVGRNPPESLVEQARRRGLPWRFTGFVDDVRPFVHEAQVYVIPLRVGGGTRIKVFEAMAMGCPVVATGIGVEGLSLEAGRHYLAADAPEEMAAAVLRLLAEPALRARLAREARRHVEENYSARRAAQAFEAICERAVGRRGIAANEGRASLRVH